jgi:spore maturation protein CgeB
MEELMLEPARRQRTLSMIVAGPQYPSDIRWPANVNRIDHLPPSRHAEFYNSQRFTLNVTRADMIRAGYSPSVRLFEAAACAVPVISDYWKGLETFFTPGKEILISRSSDDTLQYLSDMTDEQRLQIGNAARQRVMTEHTAACRAIELEQHVGALLNTLTVSHVSAGESA